MKKRFCCFIIAAIISLSFSAPINVSPNITASAEAVRITNLIVSLEINAFRGDVRLRGQRPDVNASASCEFENELSRHFDSQFNEFIRMAGDNTRSLLFEFKVTVSGDYVNVIFICGKTAATTEQFVLTTVIDSSARKIVRLHDIAGVNGSNMINQAMFARIAANPSRFSTSFTFIANTHSFYMDGSAVVLLFNEFGLLNTRSGIAEIHINTDDITNVAISGDGLYENSSGVIMVQLRKVADIFDFNLIWNETNRSVIISDVNDLSVVLFIGNALYSDSRFANQVEFESPPEIFNDRTYLPLSFFDQTLGLIYHIHLDGTVTLSRFDCKNLSIIS